MAFGIPLVTALLHYALLRWSLSKYEAAAGRTFRSQGSDETRLLCDGMTVPVFFDARDPKRRVLYCEALCEVIPPGQA